MSPTTRIASAYDAVAPHYDQQLARDAWMRRALWRHFARTFRAGDRLLDVGCGTGIDSLYLASIGMHVTAVDASVGMVERLRTKLARTPLEARVDVHVGDVVEVIGRFSGPFDGMISSFAAMNAFDLPPFASQAARIIRPGGRLVAHVLSPGHAARGWAKRAWRALRPKRRADTIDVALGGQHVTHVVLPEGELYHRYFAAQFIRRRAYALGLVVRRAPCRAPPARRASRWAGPARSASRNKAAVGLGGALLCSRPRETPNRGVAVTARPSVPRTGSILLEAQEKRSPTRLVEA
jgi:SAM-dependent methyltransferase